MAVMFSEQCSERSAEVPLANLLCARAPQATEHWGQLENFVFPFSNTKSSGI